MFNTILTLPMSIERIILGTLGSMSIVAGRREVYLFLESSKVK